MGQCNVLIVGAGPAGSIAAAILARAGLRVTMLDRARFPRPKLCGDTLNPGACRALRSLGLMADIDAIALPVEGMIVTGEGRARVEGRYPPGTIGRALTRRDLDVRLATLATTAGAELEERVVVHEPIVHQGRVEGVRVGGRSGPVEIRAPITIAADGRRSRLALGLRLIAHPARPRRWAIGTYYEGIAGLTNFGEMHVRRRHYLGIAPLPGGLANTCLVVEAPDARLRMDPLDAIRQTIDADPSLRDRFTAARPVERATVMGPLAVDASAAGAPGLLLAGDAAGFVDPMTGDGLRFAIAGAQLAAEAALAAVTRGLAHPELFLADARARAFAGKYRFNRALRTLVASPAAVRIAALGSTFVPGVIAHMVRVAGDVRAAA
jgi:flavin-dependent dehydrogenase